MSDYLTDLPLIYRISFLLFISTLLISFLNHIFLKKKILIDDKNFSKHKKFINLKSVPLTGGLSIFFIYLLIYFNNELINLILITVVFLLGILSDTKKLNSPALRFFLQIIFILFFVFLNNINIQSIRVEAIDQLLLNSKLFALFFTTFCILILLNGSNFIDGTNLQCSGYYLSVLITFLFIHEFYNYYIEYDLIIYLTTILFVFIIFNFFTKSFLGDGGSYFLAFIIGMFSIKFINYNENVSPYFIALIFWYPAFENLFSILRRMIFLKDRVGKPDNYHLHHLFYEYISKKNKNKNNFFILNGTGLIFTLYNLFIFFLGTNYIYQSLKLIILIFFSIIIYLTLYIYLKKKLSIKFK